MKINILNSNNVSPLLKMYTDLGGSYGLVHIFEFLSKKVAVKLISFSKVEEEVLSNVIGRVIHEYCLTKISSILECGPVVSSNFGFDIIIYENAVEFAL